jgi:hypothetical protein
MTEPSTVLDDEQHIVFGWAQVITTKDGKIVFDRQGDYVTKEEELAKAAYSYVLTSRDGGEMHLNRGVGTVIESMVFTQEKMDALGIEKGTVPIGWWVGFKIHDAGVWEKVKKGEYSAFSVHGAGRRTPGKLERHRASTPAKDWMDKVRAVLHKSDIAQPADLSKGVFTARQRKQRVDAAVASARARKGKGTMEPPKGGDYRGGKWYDAEGNHVGNASAEDGPITPVAGAKKKTGKKPSIHAAVSNAFKNGGSINIPSEKKVDELASKLKAKGIKVKKTSKGTTFTNDKGQSFTLVPTRKG